MRALLFGLLPLLPIAAMLWGFWIVANRWSDRRFGGRGQASLLRRALRTGEVPRGADDERWLEQSRRLLRKRPHFWVGWVIPVGLLAVNGWSVLEDPPDTTSGVLVTAVVFLVATAFLVGVFVVLPRTGRRRWERLGAELERRSARASRPDRTPDTRT